LGFSQNADSAAGAPPVDTRTGDAYESSGIDQPSLKPLAEEYERNRYRQTSGANVSSGGKTAA
jgi:hypothetical protein